MYNYDVILAFEFQVYKGGDKENVINDNINLHVKALYLCPLSLSLLNKLPRGRRDKQ